MMQPIVIAALTLALTNSPAAPVADQFDNSYARDSLPTADSGLIHPFYRPDSALKTHAEHPVYQGEYYSLQTLD